MRQGQPSHGPVGAAALSDDEQYPPCTVRIGTWNTHWAVPGSERGIRVRTALGTPECDVLCVTEGSAGVLPADGHVIDTGTDWGYPLRGQGHRKVLLWSRSPWTEVDPVGSRDLPAGRFLHGATDTSMGPLTVIGTCIPWGGAHVLSGSKDRTRWQDHLAWLGVFTFPPRRRRAESRFLADGATAGSRREAR